MSNCRVNVKQPQKRRHCDWRAFLPVSIICAVLLLCMAYAVVAEYRDGHPQKSDMPVVALRNEQDLHLDRSQLTSPQLHLFEANASGQKAKFLVQRTPDKTVHVALASCRACYRSHNPHYTRNGEMICGQCRESMTFESGDQRNSTNHCTLAEIPHTETDYDVTVSAQSVISEATKLLR